MVVVVVAGGVLVVCWWSGVKEFGFDIYKEGVNGDFMRAMQRL